MSARDKARMGQMLKALYGTEASLEAEGFIPQAFELRKITKSVELAYASRGLELPQWLLAIRPENEN